ncbi:MAG: cupin domain-containing protein [Pseudomonadota bacterium]
MPPDLPREFWTGERCFITEIFNREDYPEVSVARTRVEPGVTTELHALSVSEWYLIESGQGRMYVGDDEPRNVAAGDVVSIPKNLAQKIENTGEIDLLFLCLCAPRFTTECYRSLE